jgi:hypothetical protein
MNAPDLLTRLDGVIRVLSQGADDPTNTPLAEDVIDARDWIARRLAFDDAAPDLLAVCKDIRDFLRSHGYDTRMVDYAIGKTEGGTA